MLKSTKSNRSYQHEARRLTLKELTQHGMRDQIEADNYVQIAEGIIQRLEEKCRNVKVTLQSQMTNVCRSLYNHRGLSSGPYSQCRNPLTATGFLVEMQFEQGNRKPQCESLSFVAKQLSAMNTQIESLPSS